MVDTQNLNGWHSNQQVQQLHNYIKIFYIIEKITF